MLEPSDRAEVLGALAAEIRELLRQAPAHQRVIAVPFAIEEGLHETFEWFLREAETPARDGEFELGGVWTNRRPRSELDRLAGKLEARERALGRRPGDESNESSEKSEKSERSEKSGTTELAAPEGHVPVAEICEEYPDVASSLSKLLRVLAENPAIRRHGPSPLRLTVHLEDFAGFAAKVRRAAPRSD